MEGANDSRYSEPYSKHIC